MTSRARARSLSPQTDPSVEKLRQDVLANLADLERQVDRLDTRLRTLEQRDDWFRKELYPWLLAFAASIPYTPPPSLPK